MPFGRTRGALRYDRPARSARLNLHYSGQQPATIRGAVTGHVYQFSHLQPVQPVDPKDAVFLLAGRLFRLAR